MAVARMRLLRLIGAESEFDDIVMRCVMNREFCPADAFDIMQSAKALRRMDTHNPYSGLLQRIAEAAELAGIALDYCDFSLLGGMAEAQSRLDSFIGRIEALHKERGELTRLADEDEMLMNQLAHMHGIGSEVEWQEFFDLKYVDFRFGRIPREVYDHFMAFFTESDDFMFFTVSQEKDYVYGITLVPSVHATRVDTLFASLRFERIYISGRIRGNADAAESRLEEELAADRRRTVEIDAELAELIANERSAFLASYSLVKYLSDAFDLRRYAVTAEGRFFLYGWVPKSAERELTALLAAVPSLTYQFDEPDTAFIDPPTKLRNWRIFKRFEPFVNMYGLPSYNEFDPTPLMGVVYTLLFGVMFGDLGQGLVLALIGSLMWRFKRMWLGRVLIYTGICGAVAGFFYGSLFGFEGLLPFGFNVLESGANTSIALNAAIYIGLAILTFVMLINIVNGLRTRDYERALFSQNGLAGLLLFAAVMLVVLPMLGFLNVAVPSGVVAVMFAAPVVLIVLRHPLGKLLKREPDWKPESIGGFLTENIFELIEVFLAYVTGAVSFVRIAIFVISHAAMMSIVFMLAGGHENPSIPVVVIGNAVVMGIEGLLVGIQVLRLNFYEMFGRFYSGGGRPFKAAAVEYKQD